MVHQSEGNVATVKIPVKSRGEPVALLIGKISGKKCTVALVDPAPEAGSELAPESDLILIPETKFDPRSKNQRRWLINEVKERLSDDEVSEEEVKEAVYELCRRLIDVLNKNGSKQVHKDYEQNRTAGSAPKSAESPELSEKERDEAIGLLKDPAFFYKLGKLFEKGWKVKKVEKIRFVIGEERKKRLLPVLIAGIPLGYTSIIRVVGEPGTAKDSMIRLAAELLPFKIEERGYITPASLRYSQGTEILYIPDSEQLKGEMGRHLRLMRSDDGGLIAEYAIKDKETGEMTTKVIKTQIRGIITSSNELSVDPALASGMWTLTTNADPELTKRVKEEKLRLHAGERELIDPEELEVWKNAFKVAVEDDVEIIIPYAPNLLKILDSKKSASRRDPDKLCELIKLVAKFRRFQKPESERHKADVVDLYIALQLGWNAIAETISELNRAERHIYDLVKEFGKATVREIADATKLGYTTCYEILEGLVKRGYLNKDKQGRTNVYTVLIELENGELSETLAERNPTPDSLIKLISELVPNFPTFAEEVVDPVTGAPLRNLERSKPEKNHEDHVGDNTAKLSPKVNESLKSASHRKEAQTDEIGAGGGEPPISQAELAERVRKALHELHQLYGKKGISASEIAAHLGLGSEIERIEALLEEWTREGVVWKPEAKLKRYVWIGR